jgi:hypothetical protein
MFHSILKLDFLKMWGPPDAGWYCYSVGMFYESPLGPRKVITSIST